MATTLQLVCGNPDGPAPNQSNIFHELLRNSVVHELRVNNQDYNGLRPSPDFSSFPLEATLTRNTGNFDAGDKIIIVYSKTTD